MKLFFSFSLALLLSLSATAAEPVKLTCITELPSTSFIVETKDDKVSMRVIHHHGAKYAPISTGLVTNADLTQLKNRAEIITALGDSFSVDWERSNCHFHDVGGLPSCTNGSARQVGKLKIEGFGFISFAVKTHLWDYVFNEINIRFYFTSNGQRYEMPMTFQASECQL